MSIVTPCSSSGLEKSKPISYVPVHTGWRDVWLFPTSKAKQFKAVRLNTVFASPDCVAKEQTLAALPDWDADNVSNDEQSTNSSENQIGVSGRETHEYELEWQCHGNCDPQTVHKSVPRDSRFFFRCHVGADLSDGFRLKWRPRLPVSHRFWRTLRWIVWVRMRRYHGSHL